MEERLNPTFGALDSSSQDEVFSVLEQQLASVIERDGAVMLTPLGTRRKARRIDGVRSIAAITAEHFLSGSPLEADPVEDFDRTGIEFVIKKVEGGRERKVEIFHREHQRSEYVVSLQNIVLSHSPVQADERVLLTEDALRYQPGVDGMPVDVYASVSSDLSGEVTDPHAFADQFTPASFEEAYEKQYGGLDVLRRWLSDVATAWSSIFQRVERVEQTMVADVRESIGLVEVQRFSYARALLGFLGLAVVVTLPAQAVVMYRNATDQKDITQQAGQRAVDDALGAKDAGSLPASAEALKQASSQFRNAATLLSDSSALAVAAASVVPKQYRSARALLEIGDKTTDAARLLALGFDKIFSDPTRRLDERLEVLGAYARSALNLLSEANKAAQTVDPSTVPEAQRAKVSALLGKLEQATQAVQEVVALSDVLAQMTGKDSLRKYLLVFQNQTELRPTGGFMGSFAEVTVDAGKIRDVKVPHGGTYDLKGDLSVRVVAPQPLQLINAVWQFQDANWSPDFPTSANKLKWFWSKSGGPTLDGVIAVNATFVEKLLAITGPIEMPLYGKTVTSDNFLLETQKAVEVEYDKSANTPKKFIGDLSDALRERVAAFSKEDWLKVVGLISQSLETKDIQIALSKPDEEAVVERYGWSGRIKPAAGDSLALIETNIAGQKTDGVVDEKVDHHVVIQNDGSMDVTLTLHRTHGGKKGEMFRGVRNVSYLRAYVPKGAKLMSGTGFDAPDPKLFKVVQDTDAPDADILAIEQSMHNQNGVLISTEGERTVFSGWMQLDPGMSQEIVLKYQLPFTAQELLAKLDASPESSQTPRAAYMLLLTSQSGKQNRTITSTIDIPARWQISWSRPEMSTTASALTLDATWDRDRVVAALLSPRP